jgi:hypothetical protein
MLRVCLRCDETHPVEFFNRDRGKPDGIYPYCKDCSRAACRVVYRKYHDKHIELKRAWKVHNGERHREINRQYRVNHPEKAREGTANYRRRLKQATPPWADLELIEFIRSECPPGWHVDHIHPLAGKTSCGLNVPWNLQHLPPDEHRRKGSKLLLDKYGETATCATQLL